MDDDELEKGLTSIYNSLPKGGIHIGFEWVNPFEVQTLTIIETNKWRPEGYTIRVRTKKTLEDLIKKIGFKSIAFFPFNLSIDIESRGYKEDVTTYTLKNEYNERMAFRYSLSTLASFCHKKMKTKHLFCFIYSAISLGMLSINKIFS